MYVLMAYPRTDEEESTFNRFASTFKLSPEATLYENPLLKTFGLVLVVGALLLICRVIWGKGAYLKKVLRGTFIVLVVANVIARGSTDDYEELGRVIGSAVFPALIAYFILWACIRNWVKTQEDIIAIPKFKL